MVVPSLKRRQLLATLIASAFLARSSLAEQPSKKVAVLIPLADGDIAAKREVAVFGGELRRLGWNEATNLQLRYGWTAGDLNRIDPLAKEIVATRPDVIVTRATPMTAAVLRETRVIPVVFLSVTEPVNDGFVKTMARPGGNATGFTNAQASTAGKQLQLLKEITPSLLRVAALFNPKTAPSGGEVQLREVEDAARPLGLSIVPLRIADASAVDAALAGFARQSGGGVLVMPDVSNVLNRKLIITAAAHYRLPAVSQIPSFVEDGGLAAYGVDIADLYRRGAGYVDQILRGAKPGDLPVQAPLKFDLIINRGTAKALGIALPKDLLVRADRLVD